MLGFEISKIEQEASAKPFRKRTVVWESIVEEGVELELVDAIIERVASEEHPLYAYSRQSEFRDKIRAAAVKAIHELIQGDQKNFSDPIDEKTKTWDSEIAHSGNDPDVDIKKYGRTLVGSLTTLAGGRENLIERVVALMIADEKRRQGEQDATARQ
ncbi:MAG: hypothetical protein WAV46_00440 [Candidatus Moraniibacteriota bacterium]